MKASELVEKLQELIQTNGDLDVLILDTRNEDYISPDPDLSTERGGVFTL